MISRRPERPAWNLDPQARRATHVVGSPARCRSGDPTILNSMDTVRFTWRRTTFDGNPSSPRLRPDFDQRRFTTIMNSLQAETVGHVRPFEKLGSIVVSSDWVGVFFWIAFRVASTYLSGQGLSFSPLGLSKRDSSPLMESFPGQLCTPPRWLADRYFKAPYQFGHGGAGVRWDLVRYTRGFSGQQPGEASLLTDYFDFQNSESKKVWGALVSEHPDLAKVLWPAAQQLAIHECYFALPELFQLALEVPSTEQLQESIDALSYKAGVQQAARYLDKKQLQDARIAIEWAKTHFSQSPLPEEAVSLEKAIREAFSARFGSPKP